MKPGQVASRRERVRYHDAHSGMPAPKGTAAPDASA